MYRGDRRQDIAAASEQRVRDEIDMCETATTQIQNEQEYIGE